MLRISEAMSMLKKIGMTVSMALAGGVRLFSWLYELFLQDEDGRRSVAFTISMIAISAKMAKADGIVSDTEKRAFIEIFEYPQEEERNVYRLFRLAQQNTAGYESYARKLSKLLSKDREALMDVMDGLFHIAKADGIIHNAELAFLTRVAEIFRIGQQRFNQLKAMHVYDSNNPYLILGIENNASDTELKERYRELVKETHPDRIMARGIPHEFVKIAQDRLATINIAWEQIAAERNL